MKVYQYESADMAAWENYVKNSSNATLYHRIGWKTVIENCFGYKTYYLMAREGAEVVGVLPLVYMKSWILGRFLVSMPFLNYGGVCSENDEAEHLLVTEAINIGKTERIDYLELHQQKKLNIDLPTSEHKVTLFRPLASNSADIWRSLPKKVRYKIRKAEENELKFEVSGCEGLDVFYDVFLYSQRNLGSPPFDKSFFECVLNEFPVEIKVSLVKYKEKVIGAATVGCFRNTVDGLWACSLNEYHHLYPNEFMYWKHLEYACNEGFGYFNFGRSSKDSGSVHFKEKFGAEIRQLYWQYYLNKTAVMPNANFKGWKYRVAKRIWKTFPPIIARAFGPHIRKHMPQ